MPEDARAYLSVCAFYRDEGQYLREWIEFHRLVGVERFFLYDNGSEDAHREVLAPYLRDGTAVVHDWPERRPGVQTQAYDDCLDRHGRDSRWIAFIDVDEFLFSPTFRPVSELLTGYEQWPAVGVNWALFGTAGHRSKPEGLVIESYSWRTDDTHIKSIVDARRTDRASNSPHTFFYREGFAVDENGRPIDERPFGFTREPSYSRLQLNHYFTKSEQEFRRKIERGYPHLPAMEKGRGHEPDFEKLAGLNAIRDEAITHYVPALREAIARAQARVQR